MKKHPFIIFYFCFLFLLFLNSCNNISVVDFRLTSAAVAGQSTSFIYTMKHVGTTPLGEITTKFYLSYDRTISENDVLLKTKVIPELLPDEAVTFNENFTIPSNTYTGNYYLIVINTRITVDAIHVTGIPNNGVDLVPTNLYATSSIIAGTSMKIHHSVYNAGLTNSQNSDTRYYLRAANGTMTLIGVNFVPSIASNQATEVVTTLEIPEIEMPDLSELYDLVVVVDELNSNFEFQENNNELARRLTIQKPLADLFVSVPNPPVSAQSGENMTVTLTLKNIGQKTSEAGIPFEVILSENSSIDDEDEVLFSVNLPAMAVDFGFDDVPLSINIPENTMAGSYYVFLVPNREQTMLEFSYSSAVFKICVHEICLTNDNFENAKNEYENHKHQAYSGAQADERQAIYLEKSELLSTDDLIEKVQHQIKIYPNPAIQRTNLSMELVEQSDIKIEVLNMSGMVLKTFQGKYNQGYATQMLDLSWVPSGTYVVKVQINKEVFMEKVVVQ